MTTLPTIASSALTPKCDIPTCGGSIASAKFSSAHLAPPADGKPVPDWIHLCDGCIDDFDLWPVPHVIICHPMGVAA